MEIRDYNLSGYVKIFIFKNLKKYNKNYVQIFIFPYPITVNIETALIQRFASDNKHLYANLVFFLTFLFFFYFHAILICIFIGRSLRIQKIMKNSTIDISHKMHVIVLAFQALSFYFRAVLGYYARIADYRNEMFVQKA